MRPALAAYLINNAVDDAELHPSSGTPPIRGAGLEKLLRDYQSAKDQIQRLSSRVDANFLGALLDVAPIDQALLADGDKLAAWAQQVVARLNTRGLGRPQYDIHTEAAQGEQGAVLRIRKQHHGLSTDSVVPGQFFLSADYAPIAEITNQINGLIGEDGRVQRGSKHAAVSNFHAVQSWLMDEAKKGRTIQRFKGLGEMNPAQLWETTVNPETRRMLQVRIEDAVAADLIFSTLMGDVVEPRRAFIESNALRVANLDV